jgi:hypothetical protein
MTRIEQLLLGAALLAAMMACGSEAVEPTTDGSFEADVTFLSQYVDTVVLEQGDARVAVVPAWQGRVMTSTASGADGSSYGWINRDLIRKKEFQPHMNAFGGEDRFWIGPEGGQYAVFFKAGDPFDLDHWQTPASIDTEPYQLVSSSATDAVFSHDIHLENYSKAAFDLHVDRSVRLIAPSATASLLDVDLKPGVKSVAFESRNMLTNTGDRAWKDETGLLSIWILGQFNPSPETTVILPYRGEERDETLGRVVNDAYFGEVPPDRLIVRPGVIFFRADGTYRSKIGLSAARAGSVLGSWDRAHGVLTIVQFTRPDQPAPYVNSMWEIQKEPYAGDAVNSYNDGPPEPGQKPLGPFYELETSSPAAALSPGETAVHVHRTIHLTGDRDALDLVARHVLGVGLDDVPW